MLFQSALGRRQILENWVDFVVEDQTVTQRDAPFTVLPVVDEPRSQTVAFVL